MLHEIKTLNNTYIYFTDLDIKPLLAILDMYPTAPVLVNSSHVELLDLIRGTVLIQNRVNRVSTDPSVFGKYTPIKVKEIK